ncbi:MAG: glycosyltransferase family 4 protein [Cyclonatronaceae bacterium]
MNSSRLRVALFTGNFIHIKDGVSLTLNRLVETLLARGMQVLTFGPGIKPPALGPTGDFVEVPSVGAPGRPEYRISLFLPLALRVQLESFRPDIIHIATPDILGAAALRFALRHHIPVISSYHTHFPSYLKYYGLPFLEPLLWKYLFWFYGKCEKVVSPSESMNQFLIQKGMPAEKMGLWSRGIEADIYHPGQRDEAYRRALGFAPEDVVVSFISRLVWEKDLRTFIDSVRLAQQQEPRIKILIGGDGPIRRELENELPDAVFTGYKSGEALARVYAAGDIFCFPSDTETFGKVSLEAMACGLPAVVADAVGSRSLVKHEETGFHVPAQQPEAFARKLLLLARDQPLRRRMSQAAVQHARTYDWPRVMQDLIDAYYEVLARSSFTSR